MLGQHNHIVQIFHGTLSHKIIAGGQYGFVGAGLGLRWDCVSCSENYNGNRNQFHSTYAVEKIIMGARAARDIQGGPGSHTHTHLYCHSRHTHVHQNKTRKKQELKIPECTKRKISLNEKI